MDIHTIPAGQELDIIVAEKVMGWTDWRTWYEGTPGATPAVKPPGENSRLFKPSTDIAAAWEVAEKVGLFKNCRHLHENGVGVQEGGTWTRTGWEWVVEEVLQPADQNTILARGETPQLAICRAALEVAWELEAANES